MPKLKTHKGIKARFKVTATGKVMHKRCGSSHLNSHKSGGKIRKLRKMVALKSGADAARYRKAMRIGVRRRGRLITPVNAVETTTTTETTAPATDA